MKNNIPKTKSLPLIFWAFLLSLLVATPHCYSQSLDVISLVAGRETVVSSGASPRTLRLSASGLRSYCCGATADNTAVEHVGVGIVQPPSGVGVQTFRGSVEPRITFENNTVEAARLCFETPSDALLGMTLQAAGDGTSFENLRVRCDETSLYGGYNVAAADLNFLELSNIADANINITVRFGNSRTGDTDIVFRQLTLGPSQRADLDIHSNVETGSFGAMRVTHDGPLGSMTASVSQYKITSTTPLNFDLIGRVPFSTRDKE